MNIRGSPTISSQSIEILLLSDSFQIVFPFGRAQVFTSTLNTGPNSYNANNSENVWPGITEFRTPIKTNLLHIATPDMTSRAT